MANEKAKELFKDEAFLKELGAAATAEEAQKLFEAKGGEITIDELNAIRAALKQKAGEKLDADELELVAGGGAIGRLAGDIIEDIAIETVNTAEKLGELIKSIGW